MTTLIAFVLLPSAIIVSAQGVVVLVVGEIVGGVTLVVGDTVVGAIVVTGV